MTFFYDGDEMMYIKDKTESTLNKCNFRSSISIWHQVFTPTNKIKNMFNRIFFLFLKREVSGIRESRYFNIAIVLVLFFPFKTAFHWADLVFHSVNQFNGHFEVVEAVFEVEGVDSEADLPEVSLSVHDGELSEGVLINNSTNIN